MTQLKEIIQKEKVIAILRGVEEDKLLPTVEAILRGGVHCIEVTMVPENEELTKESLDFIKILKKEFSEEAYIGAGTVVTPELVRRAVKAGAEYIISPNTDIKVIEETKKMDKISIPGAATPSEMLKARHAGADFVKFFPAAALGSVYLKSVKGPLGSLPILAVGGISTDNAKEFMNSGAEGIGVGGGLVDKIAISKGNYNEITRKASQLKEITAS